MDIPANDIKQKIKEDAENFKARKIVITSCRSCPYIYQNYCLLAQKKLKGYESFIGPKWCPLPDNND